MGNKIVVSKYTSELNDLLRIAEREAEKVKQRPDPQNSQLTHMSLWQLRVVGREETVESVPLPERIKEKSLLFAPDAAYLLLTISKTDHPSLLGLVEPFKASTSFSSVLAALDNLTPRGVRSAFAVSVSAQFDTRLFQFNGRFASPQTTSFAAYKATMVERWLVELGDLAAGLLFGGFFVKDSKIKSGNLIQLSSSKASSETESQLSFKAVKFIAQIYRPLALGLGKSKGATTAIDRLFGVPSEDAPTNAQSLKQSSKLLGKSAKLKSEAASEPIKSIVLSESNELQAPLKSDQKASRNFNLNLDRIRLSDSYETDPELRETDRKISKMEEFKNACSDVYKGRLFLSGIAVAHSLETLSQHGIGNVLNCAGDFCQNKFPDRLRYKTLFIKDSKLENIECVFYDCYQFIEQALGRGEKVLVHCVQGVSRSVTVVIAYLMLKLKIGYSEAFESVRLVRGIASPNIGFIVQLMAFQRRVQGDADSGQVKVFCVGSHQLEDPKTIVARYVCSSADGPPVRPPFKQPGTAEPKGLHAGPADRVPGGRREDRLPLGREELPPQLQPGLR